MSKRLIAFITTVLLFNLWSAPTWLLAEEILITENGIHLGWVTAKNTFTTCRKIIMEIADGRIEQTRNSCPFYENTSLVKGWVDSIDGLNQNLWVRDERGQIQKLYFLEYAESDNRTRLKDLEKGDKVVVTVPVPGRGEFIRIGEQAK